MKGIFSSLWALIVCFTLSSQSELEKDLFNLPDVIFEQIETPDQFSSAYELRIKQPLDHMDPDAGHFYQRVYLSHKGYDRPTVFVTEGYHRYQNRIYELSKLLESNQIIVEHRYFGASVPDSLDYSYLTLEQVTADLHRIHQLLSQIYSRKWISTGISKGGQTTIYYRYFYPDDVAVSVPYVAPLNLEYEEERIYRFLDTIGTKKCRKRIKEVQLSLLQNKEELLPLLKWYVKGANSSFTYLSLEEAYEYAVLEYPFAFWQWGFGCENIPSDTASLETLLQNLLEVSDISLWTDASMNEYASHYYQAATQMGYYAYETEGFEEYLDALPIQPHPHAAFTPDKMKVDFSGELAEKVYHWLQTQGDHFIYIYGQIDTWTATAVPPSDKVNSKWYLMKGKDHASARIRNMTDDNRKELVQTLEKWLDLDIKNDVDLD